MTNDAFIMCSEKVRSSQKFVIYTNLSLYSHPYLSRNKIHGLSLRSPKSSKIYFHWSALFSVRSLNCFAPLLRAELQRALSNCTESVSWIIKSKKMAVWPRLRQISTRFFQQRRAGSSGTEGLGAPVPKSRTQEDISKWVKNEEKKVCCWHRVKNFQRTK